MRFHHAPQIQQAGKLRAQPDLGRRQLRLPYDQGWPQLCLHRGRAREIPDRPESILQFPKGARERVRTLLLGPAICHAVAYQSLGPTGLLMPCWQTTNSMALQRPEPVN